MQFSSQPRLRTARRVVRSSVVRARASKRACVIKAIKKARNEITDLLSLSLRHDTDDDARPAHGAHLAFHLNHLLRMLLRGRAIVRVEPEPKTGGGRTAQNGEISSGVMNKAKAAQNRTTTQNRPTERNNSDIAASPAPCSSPFVAV